MHVIVVYNPKSGTAPSERDIKAWFRDADIVVDEIIEISPSIKRELKKYVNAGATIAVIGGDGTITTIAGFMAGTRSILLPLPGGTLNHFTKDLGVDQDIAVAIKNARQGKKRQIDIAMMNSTPFINNSSIGLYPASLRDRSRFESAIGKWPAAVIAGARTLFYFRSYHVTIDGDSFRTPFVFVGNNVYDTVGSAGRRKHIDQGVLSVFVVRTMSRWQLAKIAVLAIAGRADQHDEFDAFNVKSLTIHTKRKQIGVSYDGELRYQKTPLRYKVLAKKLRVIY